MTMAESGRAAGRHTAYVIFGDGTRVAVEVARTADDRARGLMFRDALGEAEGMLFPFAVPRRYGFWMKNVRVPLDILWLDERQRIVWIVESAPPCRGDACDIYVPDAAASFVVEVRGGFVARHGVGRGDFVEISPCR